MPANFMPRACHSSAHVLPRTALTSFRLFLFLSAQARWPKGTKSVEKSRPATTQTPSTILWNARFSYDFDRAAPRLGYRWMGQVVKGVRLNLAILNVLDLEPPLTITGSPSGAVSALGRRHTITVRKAF